ncbi:DNA/RNA non-specific endonuclease [Listeria sp. ILCC792]|uniref:DNA/RNA non-specific endonuclease n=1 Tax=Listeria sp. ILCC792 TaxID=1918331 RepID=UPI002101A157|nr:DNA/RNA non-specific endonuclease [Listeria sp. ILCC792]
MRLVFPYLFAISYSHSSNQSKRDSIGEDIGILSKFMDKVDGVVNETVDEPFHKDLDAFVDGMQDLSITTYTTTNRIGATSTQTVYNSYSYGQTTTIEVPKKEANMEDLLGGDNFYGNQLTDMYNEWKLANPDEEVSKSDFIVGSVHTRAFEYKSIKDEQQEKEFWVNIVSAVVIIGVGIFCPPAGLALGFAMGALEMSSAISGKDWVSGRELDAGERILRGGLSLLDIVPGVKALSSGTKAMTTGIRITGVADNVFTSGMKTATSKIDDVIRIGKSEVASRLGNLKTAANDAIQSAGKRLTTSIDEASEAVARFSDNISNALPKRQLAMEGAGVLPAGNKAATSLSKASDGVRAVLSKIDTSLGGTAKKTDGIIDDVTTIKEVPHGEHIIKGKQGRKELSPNTRYITEDSYRYTTDELGRIVDVDADNLILKTAERNEGMQRIAGREDRLIDDDGGHLIGSQFNGSGDIDNLVAQNSQINRSGGEWYSMEQMWAKALKETPPRKVSVKISPKYTGSSLRPDKFEVIYEIEGKGIFDKIIKNQLGG